MIEFDKIAYQDLTDDLYELGMSQNNFSLYDLIQEDLNKAFGVGYSYDKWVKNDYWISPKCRKQLRHTSDGLEEYNTQLNWINNKFGAQKPLDYVNIVMDNIFCDDYNIRLRLCILLGKQLSKYKLWD